MKIILAQPRGFCAGVDRAIDIVKEALKIYGPPVYVRHEIVHNKRVVEDLKEKGAVFGCYAASKVVSNVGPRLLKEEYFQIKNNFF